MRKEKGIARHPPANAVFKARSAAVALTKELARATEALRHSNAVAVYLLGLVDGHVKIPITDYKKLLEDDSTTVKIAYEGKPGFEEAVISLSDDANVSAAGTPFDTNFNKPEAKP